MITDILRVKCWYSPNALPTYNFTNKKREHNNYQRIHPIYETSALTKGILQGYIT
jgi:hypothetical protein